MATSLTMVASTVNCGTYYATGLVQRCLPYRRTLFTMVSSSEHLPWLTAVYMVVKLGHLLIAHNVPSTEGTQTEHIYIYRMSTTLVLKASEKQHIVNVKFLWEYKRGRHTSHEWEQAIAQEWKSWG